MTKTALLIRSNGAAERLRYLMDGISKQNVADVYVVLDCTKDGETKRAAIRSELPDVKIIELTKGFITSSGLTYFTRSTWQCGDYFYYAAFAQHPGYEFYWLIDDDVVFNVDFAKFLRKSEKSSADLMGFELGPRKSHWSWHKTMDRIYPDSVYGMLYPLSRLSGKAVDFLFKQRVAYDSGLAPEVYENAYELIPQHANDEAFTATTLKNNGFSTKSLYQEFKAEFSGFFSTERPVLYQELGYPHTANKIIHPVSDHARARDKFNIIYRKYGPEKMLRRAEEIVEHCGEDIWAQCFDKPLSQLVREVEAKKKS